MPELPEAETLARGLAPLLVGRTLERVRVHHADVLRVPAARFRAGVRGRRVLAVGRRAKNVVLTLSGDHHLIVNLGMTGWLAPVAPGGARPTHPALTFALDAAGSLVFDDVRRFGCVELLRSELWAERSARLGPEPLADAFTTPVLGAALARSRSPIKNWLMDQRRIAGVGNIYASEALFRAAVHPLRPARSLTQVETASLRRAIRAVLREAVRAGGTTLRNYRNVDGEPGRFVFRLRVYGREGEACPNCKMPVERLVFGNRSSFLCPVCQPTGVHPT